MVIRSNTWMSVPVSRWYSCTVRCPTTAPGASMKTSSNCHLAATHRSRNCTSRWCARMQVRCHWTKSVQKKIHSSTAEDPLINCGWLARVSVPTHFVGGADTHEYVRRMTRRFAECTPGSTLKFIADTRHVGAVDKVDELSAIILLVSDAQSVSHALRTSSMLVGSSEMDEIFPIFSRKSGRSALMPSISGCNGLTALSWRACSLSAD